jgi:hypothetical protein
LREVPVDLLPNVPLDPFDGQPIRYRHTDYGIVIYSVGDNGIDDEGTVFGSGGLRGMPADLGMRLWNPELRRLPSDDE